LKCIALPTIFYFLVPISSIDRRQIDEWHWEFNQRFGDQHRHGVEVGGGRGQPQALRFERD
jgi:hypothetical protein